MLPGQPWAFNGRTAPDFQDALRTHRLIEAIERSARSGRRISLEEIG